MRFAVEGGKSYLLKSSINQISSGPTATGIDVVGFVNDETGLQDLRNCQPPSDTAALSPY